MEALLLENKTNCAQPEQLFSSGFRVMLWTTPTAGEGGRWFSHTLPTPSSRKPCPPKNLYEKVYSGSAYNHFAASQTGNIPKAVHLLKNQLQYIQAKDRYAAI